MKYAHYFKAGVTKYMIISDTVKPIGKKVAVVSKANARSLAKMVGAKPWNF